MIFTNKQSAVAEIALLLVKRSQDYDHAVISRQVRASSANENSAKSQKSSVTSTQCSDLVQCPIKVLSYAEGEFI